MKPLARSLAASLPVIALAAFAAAGPAAPEARAGDPCYHGFAVPPLTVGSERAVEALPCAFSPTVTVIKPGETVTFTSGPGVVHLITGANQAWGSRDVELAPNATVAVTFDEPGIYPYACALHRGMSGAIVVGDGGEALAAAMAPAADPPPSIAPAAATAPAAAQPAPSIDPVVAVVAGAGFVAVLGALAVAAGRGRDTRAGVGAPGTPVR